MDLFAKIIRWIGIIFGIVKKSKELIDENSEENKEDKEKKK